MNKSNRDKVMTAVHDLLEVIEGAPLRPQLLETPRRVQRMLGEILSGYSVDIPALFKTFDGEGEGQIVIAKNVRSWSLCEHHCLPFYATVSVGYLPKDRVIGASKLERLVHAYAHRLQLQERLTRQIAQELMDRLEPEGVGVIVQGEHLCMRMRGVKSEETTIITSVMLGEFREDPAMRAEFLQLIGKP